MQEDSENYEVLLEELRVTEEELRAQGEQLAETQLSSVREREQYRSLFEHAPVPYVVTDRDGVIRQANGAASELLGLRADRMIGKPLSVFVSTTTRSVFRQFLRNLSGTGDSGSVVLEVLPRNGSHQMVTAVATPAFRWQFHIQEIRWIIVPEFVPGLVPLPTAERGSNRAPGTDPASERGEHSGQTRSDLIAWVSRELRTPVASIGADADTLALGVQGMLNPDQQAILVRIQQAQTHLVTLLDDLLTFATTSTGHLHLELSCVPMDSVVQRLSALVQPQAAARDITLTIRSADELQANADSEYLLQILVNLVNNALKFTPIGGAVSVSCEPSGDDIQVTVTDSGPGVPAASRGWIFEPHIQHGVPDARTAGSGLGLAISREVARAMNGDLTCVERQNRSAFVLRLPHSSGIADAGERE